MTILSWGLLISLVVVILFALWIIRNLLLQTEQLEDKIIDARETAFITLEEMRKLDERGVFEKDDEVGTAFTNVIKLIKNLEESI